MDIKFKLIHCLVRGDFDFLVIITSFIYYPIYEADWNKVLMIEEMY